MSLDTPQSPFGVLSNDEELVVSLVREVLGKMRAEGRMVEMVLVERALAESGMRMERDSLGSGGKVFVIRNARFFMQSCGANLGGVELVFVDTNP
jgi:hypothetical protein